MPTLKSVIKVRARSTLPGDVSIKTDLPNGRSTAADFVLGPEVQNVDVESTGGNGLHCLVASWESGLGHTLHVETINH